MAPPKPRRSPASSRTVFNRKPAAVHAGVERRVGVHEARAAIGQLAQQCQRLTMDNQPGSRHRRAMQPLTRMSAYRRVMINARRLADATVLDPEGARSGSVTSGQTARRCWCGCATSAACSARSRPLSFARAAQTIERRGATSCSSATARPGTRRASARSSVPTALVLTDPELASYKLIGARGGHAQHARPASLGRWHPRLPHVAPGRRGPRDTRSSRVACSWSTPGGGSTYSYISKAAGDHPRVDDVLAAIPATAGAASPAERWRRR